MPKDRLVRPTQDRVRESIFNIISPFIENSVVLDLFAGSGAFGLESISRGAKLAILIDNNVNSIKTIKRNIEYLGIKEEIKVFKRDVIELISKLYYNRTKFDLIFLDPPYDKKKGIIGKEPGESLAKKTLIKLDECDILRASGIIIAEHYTKDDLGGFRHFVIKRSVSYGDTKVSFIKRKDE